MLSVGLPRIAVAGWAPITSAACPEGFYRNGTIIFNCGAQTGNAYFLLTKTLASASEIPSGVQDLRLQLDAPADFQVTVVNKESGEVLIPDAVVNGEGVQQAFKGVTVETKARSTPPQAFGLDLNIHGLTMGALDIQAGLRWDAAVDMSVLNISFGYGAVTPCLMHPPGCEDFDRYKVRDMVFNWSEWAEGQYTTARSAWNDLCQTTVDAIAEIPRGAVPWYVWSQVWGKWPESGKQEFGWQAAFKYIDELAGTPANGYVELPEFQVAFNLGSVFLSMFTWCEAARATYGEEEAAWKVLLGDESQDGIQLEHWETRNWNNYRPADGFAKASGQESFVYVDANSDGYISKAEFDNIFSECKRKREGEGGSQQEVAAESNTGLPLAPNSPKGPQTPQGTSKSGPEVEARCLYQGVAYSSLGARAFAGGSTVAQARSPFPQESTEASAKDCQIRCYSLAGCAHFTFRPANGRCWLLDDSATFSLSEESRSVSGPPLCVVELKLQIANLASGLFTDRQKDLLGQELATRLARQLKVVPSSLSDLSGTSGTIGWVGNSTNQEGLLGIAFIEMPPGPVFVWGIGINIIIIPGEGLPLTVLKGELGSEDLVERVKLALHAVEKETGVADGWEPLNLDHLAVVADVQAVPAAQCYLPRTTYEPVKEGSTSVTSDVANCQALCTADPECEHFSFERSSKTCNRHTIGAIAIKDENFTAGPALCQPLPPAKEASGRERLNRAGAIIWVLMLAGVLLLVFLGVSIYLLWPRIQHLFDRCRRGSSNNKVHSTGGPKYQALATEDHHAHYAAGAHGGALKPTYGGLHDQALSGHSGAGQHLPPIPGHLHFSPDHNKPPPPIHSTHFSNGGLSSEHLLPVPQQQHSQHKQHSSQHNQHFSSGTPHSGDSSSDGSPAGSANLGLAHHINRWIGSPFGQLSPTTEEAIESDRREAPLQEQHHQSNPPWMPKFLGPEDLSFHHSPSTESQYDPQQHLISGSHAGRPMADGSFASYPQSHWAPAPHFPDHQASFNHGSSSWSPGDGSFQQSHLSGCAPHPAAMVGSHAGIPPPVFTLNGGQHPHAQGHSTPRLGDDRSPGSMHSRSLHSSAPPHAFPGGESQHHHYQQQWHNQGQSGHNYSLSHSESHSQGHHAAPHRHPHHQPHGQG